VHIDDVQRKPVARGKMLPLAYGEDVATRSTRQSPSTFFKRLCDCPPQVDVVQALCVYFGQRQDEFGDLLREFGGNAHHPIGVADDDIAGMNCGLMLYPFDAGLEYHRLSNGRRKADTTSSRGADTSGKYRERSISMFFNVPQLPRDHGPNNAKLRGTGSHDAPVDSIRYSTWPS
jgi:hypothetical protein